MKATTAEEFAALPDDVRKHVLQRNDNVLVEYGEWWDDVYYAFRERMDEKGISVDDIYFSGFWSQGDGACFDGSVHNFTTFIDSHPELAKFKELGEVDNKEIDLYVSWKHDSNHYYHERTLRFSCEESDLSEPDLSDFDSPVRYHAARIRYGEITALINEFFDAAPDIIRAHCQQLYKELETEYEHLTSEESVIEHLEINDRLQEEVDKAVSDLGLDEEEEDEQQTTQEVQT